MPLSSRECEILDERVASARAWLATYAPERAIIQVQDELPSAVEALDGLQRSFLAALAEAVGETPPTTGEGWQTAIFDVARALDLPAGRAFDALYRAFLGRPNGPRAGWLLASLDPAFVVRRLREAA